MVGGSDIGDEPAPDRAPTMLALTVGVAVPIVLQLVVGDRGG
jgi:hypothetical protein